MVEGMMPSPAPFNSPLWRVVSVTVSLFLSVLIPAHAANDETFADTGEFTPREMAQGYSDRKLIAYPTFGDEAYDSARDTELAEWEGSQGFVTERSFPRMGGMRVLLIPDGLPVADARARLSSSGRYQFVEFDQLRHTAVAPNDPEYTDGTQWHHHNSGQVGGTLGADIQSEAGWNVRTDASNVIVAVIDSGARLTHNDLRANLWVNTREIAGNGRDDDNNGYIDDVHGINARIAQNRAGNGDPSDDATSGHGTHVAGIIGGVGNNGIGVAGVAWRVQLMPLKFLGGSEGTGTTADGLECIDYAIANGADIINASYGAVNVGEGFSQAEIEAVRRARRAGIIFVAAAGNEGLNLDISRAYPASFELDNILTVGNSTRLDDVSVGSNTGSGAVDLFAPGTEIQSLGVSGDNAYRTLTGTSMAAPLVSGVAALLRAQYPLDSYRQTISRLLRGTVPVPAFAGVAQTGGRLSLAGALAGNDVRPFNDDFTDRALLAGSIVIARGSNTDATSETGEPSHAGRLSRSLWFTWTADTGGTVAIDTRGSESDTQLAVYAGDTLGSLVRIAENDNEGPGFLTSRATFEATTGSTYQIAVDSLSAGMVILNLTSAAANDAFDSAQPLAGDAPLVTTTNGNATREPGEPNHAGGAGKSLWYSWEAPKSARFQVSVYSANADPAVAVYRGERVDALTTVGANDDSGPSNANINSLISFNAIEGVLYHIAVDTLGNSAGEFTLSVTDAEWQFVTGAFAADPSARRPTITNAPAVGPDGTVYVGSSDGFFYAISPSGGLRWRFQTDGISDSSAAVVAPDGTILFATNTGVAYALNPNGTLRWTDNTGGSYFAAPALAVDGTSYFKNDNGTTTAFGTNGDVRWTYFVSGDATYGGPTVTADGTVLVPANDGALHALRPDGSLRWSFVPSAADGGNDTSGIFSAPSIDASGNIYATSLNGTVFSLTSGGAERWVYRTEGAGENNSSSIALGDGRAYFASYGAYLYALDQSDGSIVWRSSIEAQARACSPAIAEDGSIVIGSYANKLFRFSAEGELIRAWSAGNWFRSSPVLANGRIYIGNGDGKVYAFGLDGLEPASGDAYPWPQHRHGPRRLGRATAEVIGRAPTLTPDDPGRLVNLSVRNQTDHGADALTAGFVLEGTLAKELIVRSIGPGLTDFGVTNALPESRLELFPSGGDTAIESNLNWSLATGDGRELGAFPLVNGSGDSVIRRALSGAAFTATVTPRDSSGEPGIALIEVYDADTGNLGNLLSNLSARTRLAADTTVTAGFVLNGEDARSVLLRAVGPGLADFGVPGTLADPVLTLFREGGIGESSNDDWRGSTEIQTAAESVGAFPLESGSRDAALLIRLPPGAYTGQVSAPSGQSGIVLLEVYLVPDP